MCLASVILWYILSFSFSATFFPLLFHLWWILLFAIVDFQVTMMSSSSSYFSSVTKFFEWHWNHPTKAIKCKSISLSGSLICVWSITHRFPRVCWLCAYSSLVQILCSSEFGGWRAVSVLQLNNLEKSSLVHAVQSNWITTSQLCLIRLLSLLPFTLLDNVMVYKCMNHS